MEHGEVDSANSAAVRLLPVSDRRKRLMPAIFLQWSRSAYTMTLSSSTILCVGNQSLGVTKDVTMSE
eukprot:12771175-Prorocentrum_lima.AAC.1